jgi:hypothetical protein
MGINLSSEDKIEGRYRRMAHHIMSFDMSEIGRLFEPRDFPIQMFHPRVEFGIANHQFHFERREILVSNSPDIALEMLHVDRIEADDGDV